MGRKRKNVDEFIECAREVHGDRYDYSKVEYENNYTKVCIICPIHGEFWQMPSNHLRGCRCPLCSGNKRLTTEKFIEMARQVHGDRYDYSKAEYVNRRTKVCIISDDGGEFWQKPCNHINSNSGCPKCKQSKLEERISLLLTAKGINFVHQKNFPWLGGKRLDFYLPEYNVAIECQGRQHFELIDAFGGERAFEYRKCLDKEKLTECLDNGVKLLYYSDDGFDEFQGEKVWHNAEKLINNITSSVIV